MKMRTPATMATTNYSCWLRILTAWILALLFGQLSPADTLELRTGQIVQGKFIAGSVKNIRFQVNGQEVVYATQDVLNIGFSDQGNTSSLPNAVPQDQTPSPPSQQTAPAPSVPAPAAASGPQTPPPVPSAPPPAPQGQYITVPAGTTLFVRMIDGVDSRQNRIGDTFHASLESALTVGNTIVAPRGADAYGKLTQAKSSGKISGAAELTLELTGIRVGEKIVPLDTTNYNVAGKGRGSQSAQRIGGGAVIGTIIGAIAGGGKGAAIGAGVGAGAGTAVQISTHGDTVRVPSETLLEFRLENDVSAPLPSN